VSIGYRCTDDDKPMERDNMKINDRVKICTPKYLANTGLNADFDGHTGTVIATEKDGNTKLFRVKLDEPVDIPGLLLVTDDLWSSAFLRKIT
jgi:hypothetical protein